MPRSGRAVYNGRSMKITAIPQIYRHINRWREILAVLSKYGLADWIARLGPEFAKDLLKAKGGVALARLCWTTRTRLAMAELGPAFIKLGQVLSTRPDVVGLRLAEELQELQCNASQDPPEVVRAILQRELGGTVESLFAEFDLVPFASASIGQVHRARLFSGEAVVVKVQHADIERKLQVDLDILLGLAHWAERLPEFAPYRPRAMAAEFQRALRRELDFTREARNMEAFARDFAGDTTVHIPRVYASFCSSRVLTMEAVEGTRLSERDRLDAEGIDLAEAARRGANLYMKMIFSHGFYHADPHPGNVVLMPGGVIGLLDYGMVGRIDERLREDIEEILLAAASQDAEHATAIITRVGAVPAELDRAALSLDVSDFIAHFGSQSLDGFDLRGALGELTEIIRRYRITLPARIAMLLKVLVTLEGTARLLSPRFSLIEVMQPYRRTMMLQRLSPVRRLRKVRRLSWEMGHLIDALPRGLIEILEQVQSGKFDVHLDHRGLEPSVNRLVLGMLASALFLGSSLILSQGVAPTHYGVSIPGFLGCAVSLALGYRVWRAINRSLGQRR